MRYARLLLLAALVAGTACGGDGGGNGDGGDGDGGTTTESLSLVDNAFLPKELTVTAGSSLTLTNGGAAAHTFTLEDGSIDEELDPASQTSVTISLEPGEYDFACSFHPEMTGTLTVQ